MTSSKSNFVENPNKSKDKHVTFSKHLVRNAELNPPETVYVDGAVSDEETEDFNLQEQQSTATTSSTASSDLLEPRLHSSLRIGNSIDKLSSGKQVSRKIKVQSKNQKLPQPKGLKKINIPFDEQIYKGLVDLRVNEEDLGIVSVPVKAKEFVKQKEEEPVLSNYFKPTFNKEYVIKSNPPTFEIQKQFCYTGSSVLNATKKWEAPINIKNRLSDL